MLVKNHLRGQTFGRLLAVSNIRYFSGTTQHGKPRPRYKWFCACECGNACEVDADNLRRGLVKSCGCLRTEKTSERRSTAAKYNLEESAIWSKIKQRCYNSKCQEFKNYGGRGINMCQRWLDSFQNFIDDMGKRPTKKHSIDRIDNNGNYSPENCRWATIFDQAKNKRNNRWIIYNGQKKHLAEWSRLSGVGQYTISRFITKYGVLKGMDKAFKLT